MKRCVLALLLAGCSAAGVQSETPRVLPELADTAVLKALEPAVLAPHWRQSDDFEAFREPLRLSPDSELVPAVELAAARYLARLGIEIEIAADGEAGIPVTVRDEVHSGSRLVDGVAIADGRCVFDECNAPEFRTRVYIARALLTDKLWVLQHSVEHELGHVISGWGRAAKMQVHLADDAKHLMSPGCRDGVCGPWTVEDAAMFCAGAPCTRMDLTALGEL